MIKIDKEQEKIKTWLYGYDEFVVNEREDSNFHFSFWIWDKKNIKTSLIPLILGYLKKKQKDYDCILIGYGLDLEMKKPVVKAVLTDPFKKKMFVENMKSIIKPRNYLLKFSPTEDNIESIKISTLYPIEWLDKNILFAKIIKLWITYAIVLYELEQLSGKSDLSDPFKFI